MPEGFENVLRLVVSFQRFPVFLNTMGKILEMITPALEESREIIGYPHANVLDGTGSFFWNPGERGDDIVHHHVTQFMRKDMQSSVLDGILFQDQIDKVQGGKMTCYFPIFAEQP